MNISPFQVKIKEKTKELHAKAEQHPLMQSFIKGTYNNEHLLQFLINMYPIYSVVECRLLKEKNIKNPELKRTHLIKKDIDTLIPEILNTETSYLLTPLTCTCVWVSNAWSKPADLLKAELYSRWLADFYGGKMLKMMLKPNFMYQVTDTPLAVSAIREILDEPLTDTNVSEDSIINEIINFFNYHLELFDSIYNGKTQ